MGWGYDWKPYVPVARRLTIAAKYAAGLAKKQGRKPSPVCIEGRKITRTFWGNAWCRNLEQYSDFANRLPRGRTYVCNGSVVDLEISAGRLTAIVAGSEPYRIDIEIKKLSTPDWNRIKSDCSASIDSLLDLLAGKFSDGVMTRLTDAKQGLFPKPSEIKMSCSCPDWAGLCKHLAAVMYGVGSHLDHRPELLFLLRGVDHNELVSAAVTTENLESALAGSGDQLGDADLGALFGIELESPDHSSAPASRKRKRSTTKKNETPAEKSPATQSKEMASAIKKIATKKKTAGKTAKPKPASKVPAVEKTGRKKQPATVVVPTSAMPDTIAASPKKAAAKPRKKPAARKK
ncbi:MAG: SWIM zinc finger family protein [Planctomycetaceae bacterium]